MEDVSIVQQILDVALPLALTAVAAAVAWGVTKLDKIVKATETDIDDKFLAAFKEGFEKGLVVKPDEAQTPAPKSDEPVA